MLRSLPTRWGFGLLTTFALASLGLSQEPAPPTKQELIFQDPIEVQTRGPIHEAYAQPLTVQPGPENVVPKAPPPALPEEPPDQKPEASGAQWIPGYWAWDADRNDYLWVTGVYRVPPQGRTFVPGYWSQSDAGWRWVAGFWASPQQESVPYTQEPPAPLDNGPTLPAPDDNSTYIPGVWVYRETRFIWRPGFWAPLQADRVWVPPHYVWTPNGYLMIDGYWDYPLDARGLIFAPVYFNQPLWENTGWAYRPAFVVNFPAFFDSCFVRAGCFYFGDYYGPRCAGLGYRPWYTGIGRYDPIFSHYGRYHHRDNPNWIAGVHQTYQGRADGRLATPPRTLAAQSRNAQGGNTVIVSPLHQLGNGHPTRLVRTSPAQWDMQKALAQRTREIGQNRHKLDTALAGNRSGTPTQSFHPIETKSLRMPDLLQPKPAAHQTLTFPNDSRSRVTETRPSLPSAPLKTNPQGFTPPAVRNYAPTPNTFAPPVHNPVPPAPRSLTPSVVPRPVAPSSPPARIKASAPISNQHLPVTSSVRRTTQHYISPAASQTRVSPPRHSPARVSAPARAPTRRPAVAAQQRAARRR